MRYAHCLLFLLAVAMAVQAKDFILIANPSLAGVQISPHELRQIYLGTKTTLLGRRVEPVVAESGRAHEQFVIICLGKTSAGLRNYFRNLVFSGKGSMPRSFATGAEMMAYVARTPGALGYVEEGFVVSGVVQLTLK